MFFMLFLTANHLLQVWWDHDDFWDPPMGLAMDETCDTCVPWKILGRPYILPRLPKYWFRKEGPQVAYIAMHEHPYSICSSPLSRWRLCPVTVLHKRLMLLPVLPRASLWDSSQMAFICMVASLAP